MYGPSVPRVLRSLLSIGVPVNPRKHAFGSAWRMFAARLRYCVREPPVVQLPRVDIGYRAHVGFLAVPGHGPGPLVLVRRVVDCDFDGGVSHPIAKRAEPGALDGRVAADGDGGRGTGEVPERHLRVVSIQVPQAAITSSTTGPAMDRSNTAVSEPPLFGCVRAARR